MSGRLEVGGGSLERRRGVGSKYVVEWLWVLGVGAGLVVVGLVVVGLVQGMFAVAGEVSASMW